MRLRDIFSQFQRLTPFFVGLRTATLLVLLAVLVGALTEPLIPALMKPLLDRGFAAQQLDLWYVPVGIIGVFAVRGAAGFVAQYGITYIAQKGMHNMRVRLFERLQIIAPATLGSKTSSHLVNTIVYEIQNGVNLLIGSLLTLAKDSLTLLALLGYLFYLNWHLTLVVFIMFPIVALLMAFFSKRLHRTTKATQGATDELAYVVEENVLAWRAVRLHAAQAAQALRFGSVSERLSRLAMKSTASAALMTPMTQIVAACALSAVITIALWQSQTTGNTVGGFVAFTTALLMLIAPVKHLSDVAGPITRGLAAITRGIDLLENTPIETGGMHSSPRARGEFVFDSVTLRYPGAGADAVSQLHLQIHAGETLALVGSSGAGKSTLMNLLPRFIDPSGGSISLDGVALADWDLRNLRQQFALVSQDVIFFSGSIAANIALGQEIDEARVQAALRSANLETFVAGLPQGIHSSIGHNGNQLSGGQRQRLAIARALYKDAPILLLDEATSALDNESERAVQIALKNLMQGRTTITIAHRLSTIEHADRIIVMQQGQIVEQGNHASLLRAGGAYARMQQSAGAGAAQNTHMVQKPLI